MLTQEQKQRIVELAWDLARTNILHERYGCGEEAQRHREHVHQAESDLKAYLDNELEINDDRLTRGA